MVESSVGFWPGLRGRGFVAPSPDDIDICDRMGVSLGLNRDATIEKIGLYFKSLETTLTISFKISPSSSSSSQPKLSCVNSCYSVPSSTTEPPLKLPSRLPVHEAEHDKLNDSLSDVRDQIVHDLQLFLNRLDKLGKTIEDISQNRANLSDLGKLDNIGNKDLKQQLENARENLQDLFVPCYSQMETFMASRDLSDISATEKTAWALRRPTR